jgi:hypothetical protein
VAVLIPGDAQLDRRSADRLALLIADDAGESPARHGPDRDGRLAAWVGSDRATAIVWRLDDHAHAAGLRWRVEAESAASIGPGRAPRSPGSTPRSTRFSHVGSPEQDDERHVRNRSARGVDHASGELDDVLGYAQHDRIRNLRADRHAIRDLAVRQNGVEGVGREQVRAGTRPRGVRPRDRCAVTLDEQRGTGNWTSAGIENDDAAARRAGNLESIGGARCDPPALADSDRAELVLPDEDPVLALRDRGQIEAALRVGHDLQRARDAGDAHQLEPHTGLAESLAVVAPGDPQSIGRNPGHARLRGLEDLSSGRSAACRVVLSDGHFLRRGIRATRRGRSGQQGRLAPWCRPEEPGERAEGDHGDRRESALRTVTAEKGPEHAGRGATRRSHDLRRGEAGRSDPRDAQPEDGREPIPQDVQSPSEPHPHCRAALLGLARDLDRFESEHVAPPQRTSGLRGQPRRRPADLARDLLSFERAQSRRLTFLGREPFGEVRRSGDTPAGEIRDPRDQDRAEPRHEATLSIEARRALEHRHERRLDRVLGVVIAQPTSRDREQRGARRADHLVEVRRAAESTIPLEMFFEGRCAVELERIALADQSCYESRCGRAGRLGARDCSEGVTFRPDGT